MKLKREYRGVDSDRQPFYRIGLTDWYIWQPPREYGQDCKWHQWWELGYFDGQDFIVGQTFRTRKDAVSYFEKNNFGLDITWRQTAVTAGAQKDE